MALVLGAHEGAAKFESRADLQEQPFVVAKNRVSIEAADAVRPDDLIGISSAVGARQLLLLLVPQKQMPIVEIEGVDVAALSGAFAGGAEGDLAQAS